MKVFLKVLKWVGIVMGGLVAVIVVAVVALYFIGGSRLSKTYEIQVSTVAVPEGSEALARGRHVVESIGLCTECHGDNLAGEVMEDDLMFGRLVAQNLTSGRVESDPATATSTSSGPFATASTTTARPSSLCPPTNSTSSAMTTLARLSLTGGA